MPCFEEGRVPELDARSLGAVIEHSGDAIIYANTAGVIEIWNRAASSLFGYSAEEARSGTMDLIVPDKLRAAHWAGFHRAMDTGNTRLSGRPTITRASHKSGARLYVEMTFAIVRADDGTVLGAVAVARDATERYEQARAQKAQPPAESQRP